MDWVQNKGRFSLEGADRELKRLGFRGSVKISAMLYTLEHCHALRKGRV